MFWNITSYFSRKPLKDYRLVSSISLDSKVLKTTGLFSCAVYRPFLISDLGQKWILLTCYWISFNQNYSISVSCSTWKSTRLGFTCTSILLTSSLVVLNYEEHLLFSTKRFYLIEEEFGRKIKNVPRISLSLISL